jgi:hypothetical protein
LCQSGPAIERCLLASAWIRARIGCEGFATNEIGRNARIDDTLEHATENTHLTKTLVAGLSLDSILNLTLC